MPSHVHFLAPLNEPLDSLKCSAGREIFSVNLTPEGALLVVVETEGGLALHEI